MKKLEEKQVCIDTILAIARGGLTIGVCLSSKFNKELVPLRIKSYDDSNNRGKVVINPFDTNEIYSLSGNILVVDDLVDSGHTMCELCKLLSCNKAIQNVTTAVLYVKDLSESVFVPDLYVKQVQGWIEFPWEYK